MSDRKSKLRRLQQYHAVKNDDFIAWAAGGYRHDQKPRSRPMPKDLAGMCCEASTRAGTPCKRKDIYSSGRCKYHGGMSCGAKTLEGKARQLEGYRRWQAEQKRHKDSA